MQTYRIQSIGYGTIKNPTFLAKSGRAVLKHLNKYARLYGMRKDALKHVSVHLTNVDTKDAVVLNDLTDFDSQIDNRKKAKKYGYSQYSMHCELNNDLWGGGLRA